MPRYYKLLDHYKKFGPPIHVAFAAVHGMTKKTHQQGSLEDLANQFGRTGGQIRG